MYFIIGGDDVEEIAFYTQEAITKMPITLTKSDKLKGYRGILGKADEKLLKEFELEANDIY
ncbi:hypothetical protein C5S32_05065 [ANME-1 cluster archaeon GoMg1]|nr:hypothetical protein [ANME-1 cluster archaeon GoMg1]